MKIWVATFLLFSGVIKSSIGQENPDHEFETFKDYHGPPSQSYFPELFDVSESTYLAEDDGDGRRSFKVVDAKPRITRSFLYVSPEDVEDVIVRDRRSAPEDYDYTRSYRDFVRENFGLDEAKTLAVEEDDNGEDSEYERIRELSQKEAEESKKHPEFCKVIHKDGKECTICKNPKTNAQSETCSYSSKPKPKKYAYKRERNYNSKDEEDDDDDDHEEEASEKEERRTPKQKRKKSRKQAPVQKTSRYEEEDAKLNVKPNKKNKPRKQIPRQTEEYYDDQAFKPSQQPYVTGAVGRKVDQVLEEFKKRDWSKCKRKSKKGLTCYYCKDAKGASHEECMYISDDNPEAEAEATPHQKDIEDYEDTPKTDTKKVTARSAQRQRQSQAAPKRSQNVAPEPEDSESNATEKRTIKRMVSVKIHENGDSDPAENKQVFYKKIVQVRK